MAVTVRNFAGSYFEKERLTTVQYPEERSPLPENYRNFPFLIYDDERSARRVALRRLQDLRKGMSAAVHLHRQKRGQKARLHGQTAVLSGRVRHRHLGLHELSDLRRGLSIRGDQDGQGIRAESARALRSLALAQRATFQINEYYHRIHPVEAEAVDKGLADAAAAAKRRRKLQLKQRRKLRQRRQLQLQPLRRNLRQMGRHRHLLLPKRLCEARLEFRRWDVFRAYRSARDIQTSSSRNFFTRRV